MQSLSRFSSTWPWNDRKSPPYLPSSPSPPRAQCTQSLLTHIPSISVCVNTHQITTVLCLQPEGKAPPSGQSHSSTCQGPSAGGSLQHGASAGSLKGFPAVFTPQHHHGCASIKVQSSFLKVRQAPPSLSDTDYRRGRLWATRSFKNIYFVFSFCACV